MYYPYHNKLRSNAFHKAALSFLFVIFFLNIQIVQGLANIEFTEAAADYRARGYDAQQEGDFDKALTFYSKALTMTKEDVWIYNNVGVIYEQMGLVDQAESNYLKAIQINPDYLPPYTNLAFLFKEQGDVSQAIVYLKERISRAEKDDQWIPVLTKELNSIDPDYRTNLVDSELKDVDQRLYEMAQEELSLNMARADGHLREAKEMLGQKRFDEALNEVEKGLVFTPNNPRLIDMKPKIINEKTVFNIRTKVQQAIEFLDAGDMESSQKEFQKILTIFSGKSVQE